MMFLFDDHRALLAEINLERGAMRHIVLTSTGERALGPFVTLWQTRGLPNPQSIGDATYREYVQPREPRFRDALVSWTGTHHICAIEVPDKAVHLWESLARLPLDPSERFAFLLAIRLTPAEALGEWKSTLDEAEHAWSREEQKTRQTVQGIKQGVKQKMDKRLSSLF